MKTRDNIYKREGTVLLRLITTYHALRYDQVLQFFPRNHRSLRTFITTLIKQGRIYHDKEKNLLCDSPESAASPDYGMIAAFWLLLDFKKDLIYHTSGDFPIKLHFFLQDQSYEVIYVAQEQETLMNHIIENIPSSDTKRFVILESRTQAGKVRIDNVTAYCLVASDGSVSYYQLK